MRKKHMLWPNSTLIDFDQIIGKNLYYTVENI